MTGAPEDDTVDSAAALDAHRRTLDVYEDQADRWEQRRSPELDPARAFTARVEATSPEQAPVVLDAGCGPGWHLEALPPGTIALDGAAAMLGRVGARAPRAPRVQADLRALPLRRRSLDGVWAERSLVHLERGTVPMALWDLHRSLRVGGLLCMSVFEGDTEHGPVEGDDFPGRSFHAWPEQLLRSVLEGAGFELELLERSPRGDVDLLRVWARRSRTLADTVSTGMRLLLVGLNPSWVAADAGVGFHRAGNRAWPALAAAGLSDVDRDPLRLLAHGRIGMTDLVKAPSARADGLSQDQYRHGVERLERLCAWLRPAAVCVVGLSGWRAAVDRRAVAGVQDVELGGRPVYLMPNPSGANAHVGVDDLAEHLRAAAQLARDSSGAAA